MWIGGPFIEYSGIEVFYGTCTRLSIPLHFHLANKANVPNIHVTFAFARAHAPRTYRPGRHTLHGDGRRCVWLLPVGGGDRTREPPQRLLDPSAWLLFVYPRWGSGNTCDVITSIAHRHHLFQHLCLVQSTTGNVRTLRGFVGPGQAFLRVGRRGRMRSPTDVGGSGGRE